jgi:hypothetical protein
MSHHAYPNPEAIPSDEELYDVARRVRSEFEQGTLDPEEVLALMHREVPHISRRDTTETIASRLKQFPAGNCVMASVVLLDRVGGGELMHGNMESQEEKSEVAYMTSVGGSRYKVMPHTWLGLYALRTRPYDLTYQYPEVVKVADISADQFGGPKVYVGPQTGMWSNTELTIEDDLY